MAISYSEARYQITDRLAEVMKRYHPDLAAAGVIVGVLEAANDKEGEPAVKHAGYAALATIKIVSLKDRVLKKVDAEILLDVRQFEDLSEREKDALLDHELCHIDLKEAHWVSVLDTRGEPTGEKELRFKRDDLDRPKLVSVKGDWSAGDGFEKVCRRHGEDAIEFHNLRIAHTRARRYADEGVRD